MVDGVHNVAPLASGPASLESGDARCSRPVRALRIYSARIARETYGTGERKNLRINESMTKLLANLLCFTMLATAQADPNHARDAKAIAKQMPVSELDSTLPSISFEKWLGIEAGREADIRWEVNDCGEQTGTAADRGRDFPMCVEADAAMKDKRSIVIMIAVGSFKKGITGKPSVSFGELDTPGERISLSHLSDLPAALMKTHHQSNPEIAK